MIPDDGRQGTLKLWPATPRRSIVSECCRRGTGLRDRQHGATSAWPTRRHRRGRYACGSGIAGRSRCLPITATSTS